MQHHCLLLLLAYSLFSCKNTQPARPPCDTQVINIPQDTSYLSTPLVIPTQLIEDKLNHAIGRYILNDTDFENINNKGKRDKLKLRITRLGDIQIHWTNNVARYQAPLLVLLERQIVSKRMLPIPNSLAVKTEFSLRLVFETTVDIGEDWKLQPKTQFVSFDWLSDVKILGGLIDVKHLVERRLMEQMPQILDNMNKKIRATVHLERAITRVWLNIQKPMIINRKKELVWLKINPIQFELGSITTQGDNLLIQSRISATTATLLGENPAYTIDSILPPLVKRRELPNNAYLYMLSETPYNIINDIINQKLTGQEFVIADRRIKIKAAEVWSCGADLVLHLTVADAFNGDIYFKGKPSYEPDSLRIMIQNFDFEVVTQESLVSSADWLLHSSFKEQMKDALSIELAEKMLKIPYSIMEGIERGRAGKKMDFVIEKWDFRPQQIWVRQSDIATLIIVNAQVRIQLEKLGR